MQPQLKTFRNIKHSYRTHDALSVGAASCNVERQQFANSLAEIYKSSDGDADWKASEVARVRPFTIYELHACLCKLASNKCGDHHGIVAEMLKHGSKLLHTCILYNFNSMLTTGIFPEDWHHTLFKMLLRIGNLNSVDN